MERAEFLENYNEFKQKHGTFSSQGQSDLCVTQDSVPCHYTCYVLCKGNLIELDGCLEGPHLIKENIKENEIVDEVIIEIRKRLGNGIITEQLSIMYLTTEA